MELINVTMCLLFKWINFFGSYRALVNVSFVASILAVLANGTVNFLRTSMDWLSKLSEWTFKSRSCMIVARVLASLNYLLKTETVLTVYVLTCLGLHERWLIDRAVQWVIVLGYGFLRAAQVQANPCLKAKFRYSNKAPKSGDHYQP